MTELERRALLGDREAQKECTEKGILLPCPFCGCGEADTKWHHGYWSIQCGYAHDASPSKHCFLDWGEFNSAEEALSAWNTRQAPPIGRCGTCKRRHLRSGRNFCEVNGIMQDDDYCSYYEPREGK